MFKFLLLSFAFLFTSSLLAQEKCIPAYEYLPFQGDWVKPEQDGYITLGSYSRISADGNLVLRSLSGSYLSSVTLMRLSSTLSRESKVTAINTKLTNEAFPVQGSWRFLANIDGSYYRTSDFLVTNKPPRLFKTGITGFYATAAENLTTTDVSGEIYLRTLSWPNGDADSESQGAGPLSTKVSVIVKNEGSYKVKSESKEYSLCRNLQSTEGGVFTLPMISTDANEFSALPVNPKNHKNSMRIYKILPNNKDCELVDDIGFAGAKMIFGYPIAPNKKSPVIFRAGSGLLGGSGVYIYDRDLKHSFELDGFNQSMVSVDFPGMTYDGRVIFAARWQSCDSQNKCTGQAGYVRVDPFQTPVFKNFKAAYPLEAAHFPECITEKNVSDSEKRMVF